MSTTTTTYELGTGTLRWNAFERRTDRYGTVGVFSLATGELDEEFNILVNKVPVGTRGALKAEVVEVRESAHVGDLFRGIGTEKRTAEGEVATLGEGTFIVEWLTGYGPYAGVQPYEPRDADWLDPEVLYSLHDSVVRLFFEAAR